ncbi:MAG: protein kinase, partial [Polyangiales bacterium]
MKRHRTADLEPTAFGGRYTLLRRLAVGGMAEIYLARQAAMAGFEKEVVIKRLRAELADDPRIVEMFLDEARIGALLNHPNIVHVYDVDEHDGIPYIAMEYIVGEELNELCRRGLTHGRFLPIEHA